MNSIIVSSLLIAGIKSGTQTQMRRVVKPDAPYSPTDDGLDRLWATGLLNCPFGQPGNLLWVREQWRTLKSLDELGPRQIIEMVTEEQGSPYVPIWYGNDETIDWQPSDEPGRWRSPIHMPRVYSRILLEITSIRMERLNSISREDCFREGIAWTPGQHVSPIMDFENLWNLNYGHNWPWESNPQVWVISFNIRNQK